MKANANDVFDAICMTKEQYISFVDNHLNLFYDKLEELAASIMAQYPVEVEQEVWDHLQDACNLASMDTHERAAELRRQKALANKYN